MAITPPPRPPPTKTRTRLAATAFLLIWLIFSIFEPANGARGGHPRTVPYSKMISKGRTELQLSQSRAKFDDEVAGDVRFCVAPQKSVENIKKPISFRKIFADTENFKRPKTCEDGSNLDENLIESIASTQSFI